MGAVFGTKNAGYTEPVLQHRRLEVKVGMVTKAVVAA